jgi:hypothetical protein
MQLMRFYTQPIKNDFFIEDKRQNVKKYQYGRFQIPILNRFSNSELASNENNYITASSDKSLLVSI